MREALRIAHEAGRKVALTLSDIACIGPHRDDFLALIDGGGLDLLFANEAEIKALAEADSREQAIAALEDKVPLLVVTCGADGAIAVAGDRRVSVPAARIGRGIVDTTGAGDLFAAGFLYGHSHGRSLEDSLRIGAIAAAEVISHFGARPEADLRALVDAL